ncbi:MAG: hypothetical protein IKF64_02265 [Eubacterium sp.]|nr:hypothetical protein [Eubacterium sp.]
MINTQRVNEALCTISGLTAEEVQSYSILVQNCISVVENALTDASYENDNRVIFLAATRAYYNISLTKNSESGIREFTAGDVKISTEASSSDNALTLYRNAVEAASKIVRDNGFVFRGV